MRKTTIERTYHVPLVVTASDPVVAIVAVWRSVGGSAFTGSMSESLWTFCYSFSAIQVVVS